MPDNHITEQARYLEELLPSLMRRMFTLTPPHPLDDLPLAQRRVLTLLHSGPLSVSAISTECGTSISAATQIADRLEKAGLVERMAAEEDRRQRIVGLTHQGKEWMGIRRARRLSQTITALSRLSLAEREQAIQAIEMLRKAAVGSADDSTSRQAAFPRGESDYRGARLEDVRQ